MNFFSLIQRKHIILTLAIFAAVAMILVSEISYWQSNKTLDQLSEISNARAKIQDLQLNIQSAETGQRGYLLTNRNEYLQPYNEALQKIEDLLKFLELYYLNASGSKLVLNKLHSLTDTKLSELALTIQLHEEGRGQAAIDIVLSNIGKEKMDAIQLLSNELVVHETTSVANYRNNFYQSLMLRRISMAVLSVISLFALFLYLRLTVALKKQQQELQRVVQVERERLEIEVRQRTAQLSELTHHLLNAREDERNRLARNLHDELGALLTSAKLDAARIKSRLVGKAPEALELLAHLVGTINSGIALGRGIIEDLRPSALSNLGLAATLEILANEFAEHSGVKIHCELETIELRADAELMVYRLVQEAITNITKYAAATHVWLTLGLNHGLVEVSVRDDGVGFDASVPTRSAYGLAGMRFRVAAAGGTLTLVSAPGKGTFIHAKLPKSTLRVAQT